MTDFSTATSLDPHEEHFRIPGQREDALLFLRYLPAERTTFDLRRAVVYVHGATFPSALSSAHRFDGRSWRDALGDAGFDVWGLDLYGFGHSDRYPEMDRPAAESPALCVADDAARQVEAAVRFILAHQNIGSISLIAHSWGSVPASLFAGEHPALVERLVLFAPIARRDSRRYEQPGTFPAWRIVTLEDQWDRFVEDVQAHETACAVALAFRRMGSALSRQRSGEPQPRSVRREDAVRPVQRDHQGLARPARLGSGEGARTDRNHPRRMGRADTG
jgi:pimeloyl-ACP methyl ester carboxylesterase